MRRDRRFLTMAAALALGVVALGLAGVTDLGVPNAGVGGQEESRSPGAPPAFAVGRAKRAVVTDEPAAVAAAKRSFEVRVVRADTRSPMPGAEVRVCMSGCGDPADLEAQYRTRGFAVRADDDGVLCVDAVGPASVFVRQEGLVGALSLQEPGAHELLMHPDRAVSVRVVDVHGGAAAGVALSAAVPGEGSWYGLGATGDDGVRAWPDFGLFLARRAETPRGLRVRAALPGHEGIVVETEGLPAHGATIDLRLPATGQITIRVLDPAGRPVLGQWSLELSAVTVDQHGDVRSRTTAGISSKVGGVAVIERVPFDELFEVAVRANSAVTQTLATTAFRGPTAVQPTVEAVVQLPLDVALVRGRAVEAGGCALRGGRLSVRCSDGLRSKLFAHALDAEGGFLLVVPEAMASRRLVSASAQWFPSTDFRQWISADLRPYAPFQPGITELGDVVFAEFPVLVAGRVVPAPGAACKDFHLLVEHRAPGGDWRVIDVQLRLDGSEFAALMPPMPGDYRLRVVPNARCHIPPDPIPFAPGQRDLEVVLDRGHTLELRVRLGGRSEQPHLDLPVLRAELRPTAGEAMTRLAADRDGVPSSGGWRRSEGAATVRYWNGLVAGTYELRMLVGPQVMRVVPGIRVPATHGGPAEVALDLSAEIQPVTLRVRTLGGEAARFQIWPLADGGLTWGSMASTAAPVRQLVCRGASDLWILAPGYAPVCLRAVDGDRTIVLEPCRADLRLQVDGISLPEGIGLRLTASADPALPLAWDAPPRPPETPPSSPWASLDSSWPARVSARVGTDGVAALTLLRPGPQRLTLQVCAPTGQKVDLATALPIVDVSAGSSRSVRISVPAADLERALQDLRDR